MDDSKSALEIGQNVHVKAKDIPRRPENVFVAGNVTRVHVAGKDGFINTLFFSTEADARAYLEQQYADAREATDTSFNALDSLDPFVSPNQYSISQEEVWSLSQPDANEPLQQVTMAYIDKNPPNTHRNQRSLKQQNLIGIWAYPNQAHVYYSHQHHYKRIIDDRIPGKPFNVLEPGEIYLQTRPVMPPAHKRS